MKTSHKVPLVLVLSSATIEDAVEFNRQFIERINAKLKSYCQVEIHNYDHIGMTFKSGELSARMLQDDRDISEFQVVYLKSCFNRTEQAIALGEVLRLKGIRFISYYIKNSVPTYKLSQMAKFASLGLRIPVTYFYPSRYYLKKYEVLKKNLGSPFIFKSLEGSHGNDNYLITSKDQLKSILNAKPGKEYIAQEFISNNSDLRLIVVEGKIKLVIERKRKDKSSHLNNTFRGASVRDLKLNEVSQEVKRIAIKSAKVMGRDVVGVDIVLEQTTGKPYLLEVNANPQISTGSLQEKKAEVFSEYFKDIITK